MRRRVMDVSRLKRLPVRKTKTVEPVQTSSLLYIKLFSGWSVIVLLDLLVGFRLEYMYPAFMFLRSVLDSYKYHGLIFSLMFVCMVTYLDVLFWTLLVGPWLFVLASSCVWLEFIRTSDHVFGYTSGLLWILFAYVEVTHRLNSVPPSLVDFSRPFAAHCIGYPVVTVSFLVKHQVTHYIRQCQQKQVMEENAACYEILQQALPHIPDEGEESSKVEVSKQQPTAVTTSSSRGTKPVSSKTSNAAAATSSVSKAAAVDTRTAHGRASDGPQSSGVSMATTSPPPAAATSRPLSAGSRNHQVAIRKQAMVKAVPRTDLTTHNDLLAAATATTDKSKLSVESLLKQERLSRSDAETENLLLHKNVKKLEADLQASRLQEEEASQRVEQLLQQEKAHKIELQRLRNESENLQNKVSKLHSGRQDQENTIAMLEQRLKEEADFRVKVEQQLRDQRSQATSQSAWTQEEVKDLKAQLADKETGLAKLRDESQRHTRDHQRELVECRVMLKAATDKSEQLGSSLAGETRVKIELFTALSEARRKHDGLLEELKKKSLEVDSLLQDRARMVALQSAWSPSLSPHH